MSVKLEHKFPPLPRKSPQSPSLSQDQDRYEVLIVGGGPAGAFLNLLLARFGITSRLCIDSSAGPIRTGHADGLTPRTLEILKSLDLADEIINHSAKLHRQLAWVSSREGKISHNPSGDSPPLELVFTWRYQVEEYFGCTTHQGWVLNTLNQDLAKYSPSEAIEYGTALLDLHIDANEDPDYPALALLSNGRQEERRVRAKYIVGADGAHSVVRKALGIEMVGESMDHVYGVIDMVAATNFPSIRQPATVEHASGTMLTIPRERLNSGDLLTRFYVPFPDAQAKIGAQNDIKVAVERQTWAARKAGITPEGLIARIKEILKPYQFAQKEGTEIDWITAYQIGRRLAERIAEKDHQGNYRAFLIGDSCHTHSPKEGQGMNVSMADALDLAWKLAHVLHGLSADPNALFSTFASERSENASMLIDMDKKWYAERYSRHLQESQGKELQMAYLGVEIFNFMLGLNIQYGPSYLVDKHGSSVVKSQDNAKGAICEGRRLVDRVVRRYADENLVHVQDIVAIDGKYRIVVFTTSSVAEPNGATRDAMEKLTTIVVPRYPKGTLHPVIIFPDSGKGGDVDWMNVPDVVHKTMEMDLFSASKEVYGQYGIGLEEGAVVVVRPDQFVGTAASLADFERVTAYLDRVLVRV